MRRSGRYILTVAGFECNRYEQAELRIERGNAALVSGDIGIAAGHFERSSRYFSGFDAALEAGNRHECATLLRYYGYRYKSHEALYAARSALQQNLGTWKQDAKTENWFRWQGNARATQIRGGSNRTMPQLYTEFRMRVQNFR